LGLRHRDFFGGAPSSRASIQMMWHWLNVPTAFGLLLLAMAGAAWRNVWFAYASQRWATAPAQLHFLGMSGPRRSGNYLPTARYSYTVNGMTYESTRWSFGTLGIRKQSLAREMRTQIRRIDPVAYYDPQNPSRSCLVAGFDNTTFATPIITSLMAVMLLVDGIS
jgi:hypothetical protein